MLQKSYPYYLANKAVYANEDLKVIDKYTQEVATSVALADAEAGECVRELPGAGVDLGVGGAVDRPLDRSRYDLGVTVVRRRVADQGRGEQRRFHHQAVHVPSPVEFRPTAPIRRAGESNPAGRTGEPGPIGAASEISRDPGGNSRGSAGTENDLYCAL